MEENIKSLFDSGFILNPEEDYTEKYIEDYFLFDKKISFGFSCDEMNIDEYTFKNKDCNNNNNNYFNSEANIDCDHNNNNNKIKSGFFNNDSLNNKNVEKEALFACDNHLDKYSSLHNEELSDKKIDHIETKSNSHSFNNSIRKSEINFLVDDKHFKNSNYQNSVDSSSDEIAKKYFKLNSSECDGSDKTSSNKQSNLVAELQRKDLSANEQVFSIAKDLVKYQKKAFNELPLSHKMKIKKEKAKLLLGEKTKRINFEHLNESTNGIYNVNSFNKAQELELAEDKTDWYLKEKKFENKNNVKANSSGYISSESKIQSHVGLQAKSNNEAISSENSLGNRNNRCNNNNILELKSGKENEFSKTKKIKICRGLENKENLGYNSESDFDYNFTSDLQIKEGKDYIIENDKIIILTDSPDEKTKKEIKILRNRISAQKSRDRKKVELREFKQFSNTLFNENEFLKGKLNEKEVESLLLKRRIKNFEENLCANCQYLKDFQPKKPKSLSDIEKEKNNSSININCNNNHNITSDHRSNGYLGISSYNNLIDPHNKNLNGFDDFSVNNLHNNNKSNGSNRSFKNNNNRSDIGRNNYIDNNNLINNNNNNINYSPNIIDISGAARRNFSNNLKIGVFAGLLVILFVLGCVLWGQFDEINSKITRQLFSLYDDSKAVKSGSSGLIENSDKISLQSKDSKSKIFNVTKNYPIVKYGKGNETKITQNPKAKISSNKSYKEFRSAKALDKFTSKLAEYNFSKYNLENLKKFLSEKKSEFLANIARKIHEMTGAFGKEIKDADKKKRDVYQFLKFEESNDLTDNNDINNKDLNLFNYDNLPVCYNTENLEVSYKFDSKDNLKNSTNKEIVHESYFRNKALREKHLKLDDLKTSLDKSSQLNALDFTQLNKPEHEIFKRLNINTKSVICRDLITNDELELETFLETSFSKMLYYLNNPEKEKDLRDLDCLYMHMLFPIKGGNAQIPNKDDFGDLNGKESNSDSYYEVGCKIFEINKIIR